MKNLSDKIISEALTFDDVLLVPAYSRVLPREVDITTSLPETSAECPDYFSCHGYGY